MKSPLCTIISTGSQKTSPRDTAIATTASTEAAIRIDLVRGPNKQYGVIPGVLGRSEYGLEIVVELAFLVQQVGLSLDKLCLTVGFLQNLKLGKS